MGRDYQDMCWPDIEAMDREKTIILIPVGRPSSMATICRWGPIRWMHSVRRSGSLPSWSRNSSCCSSP